MSFALSSIKLFLNIVDLEKNWVTSKTKGWQQSINWYINSYGLMLMMLFLWKSFTKLINLLTETSTILVKLLTTVRLFWLRGFSGEGQALCSASEIF